MDATDNEVDAHDLGIVKTSEVLEWLKEEYKILFQIRPKP